MTESPPGNLVPLFRALADESRIRIAATLIEGPCTVEELSARLAMTAPGIARHLGVLQAAGLVDIETEGRTSRFRFHSRPLLDELQRLVPARERGTAPEDFDEKVRSTFLVDGKLTSIPAQKKKRDVILEHLAERFQVDRMYGEKEVNELLANFHPDVASLRRYLVDGGWLERQIVREVPAEALMAGEQPEIKYHNMYWRPRERRPELDAG